MMFFHRFRLLLCQCRLPSFSIPFAMDIQLSPVTSIQYYASIPDSFIAQLHSMESKVMQKNKSTKVSIVTRLIIQSPPTHSIVTTHLPTLSLTRSLTLPTHSLTHSFIHPSTYSSIHQFNHSLLTHSAGPSKAASGVWNLQTLGLTSSSLGTHTHTHV